MMNCYLNNALYFEFSKIVKELLNSKKRVKVLEQQFKETPLSICETCPILEKKNTDLNKTLEKFTRGSEMIKVILKV